MSQGIRVCHVCLRSESAETPFYAGIRGTCAACWRLNVNAFRRGYKAQRAKVAAEAAVEVFDRLAPAAHKVSS